MSPDKSQVFALRLTGVKFAKNAAEWIRRKFSIDGLIRPLRTEKRTCTISKP
jgi:hypothetical protein